MRQIVDSVNAKDLVLRHLKDSQGYVWSNLYPINNGRYWIVLGKPNIAIVFKHDWFWKYGEFANRNHWINEKGLQEDGIGDSINKDDLRTMLKHDIKDIYIIYQARNMENYHIYCIDLHEFLGKSHNFDNKEGKEVRSISIHNYKRVN